MEIFFLERPMKKYLAFLVAVSATIYTNSALACSVPNNTSPQTREMVSQQGGWPISDAKCDFLNKNGLSIFVTTRATVLSGVTVGWADVMLIDNNNVVSDQEQGSTTVNSAAQPSMDLAQQLAYSSLKTAINALDFEKAASEIRKYQKSAKAK